MPATRVLNVMAFREGRSESSGFFSFSVYKFFLSAESPLLPFFLRTLDETCATVRPQWLKPDFVGLCGTAQVPFPLWTDSAGILVRHFRDSGEAPFFRDLVPIFLAIPDLRPG
jgi:hypothetical protein